MEQVVVIFDGRETWNIDKLHFVLFPDDSRKACHWVKREKSHSSPPGNHKAQKRPLATNSMISFAEDENFETRVRRYCEANQIVTPLALGRRPVSRYAVVDLKAQPHQLVALTFSRASDLLNYLQRSDVDWTQETNPPLRILDLKEGREMAYMGGWWLCVGSSFRHSD